MVFWKKFMYHQNTLKIFSSWYFDMFAVLACVSLVLHLRAFWSYPSKTVLSCSCISPPFIAIKNLNDHTSWSLFLFHYWWFKFADNWRHQGFLLFVFWPSLLSVVSSSGVILHLPAFISPHPDFYVLKTSDYTLCPFYVLPLLMVVHSHLLCLIKWLYVVVVLFRL